MAAFLSKGVLAGALAAGILVCSMAAVPSKGPLAGAFAAGILVGMAGILAGMAAFRSKGVGNQPPTRKDMQFSMEDLGDLNDTPDIFLSHSGSQKDFVEHLYNDLVRVNQRVFFDKYSLPLASNFPSRIKRALLGCKLGVVVLSEDFLTSVWPMLELQTLIENGKQVLPLFYLLTTKDLKDDKNLERWRQKWRKLAKGPAQLEQWETAVNKLRIENGIVHIQEESDIDYIDKVVTKIGELIRPCVTFDQSFMVGRPALVEEIQGHFEKLTCNRNHHQKACMVGLYGIGGLGKTTLCRSMVNSFQSTYHGRSHLIEFPTDCNQELTVRRCKTAMKQLFNLREEVLNFDSFDQVIALMKEHAKKHNLFLAIDNIGELSSEEAGRLLDVEFSDKSKLLLTSRSKEILQKLLSGAAKIGHDYYHIDSLPAPNKKDAFQIFQQSGHLDVDCLPSRDKIDRLLEGFSMDGRYHPLGVQALGKLARSRCGREDSNMNGQDWLAIFQEAEETASQRVGAVIRLNYDNLEEDQKHIFLDIALYFPTLLRDDMIGNIYIAKGSRFQVNVTSLFHDQEASIRWWLCIFYKTFSERQIRAYISDLLMAGVIQRERDRDGNEIIRVHDLYIDLALEEATRSPNPRFLTSTEAVEGIEIANLRRIILKDPKEVQLQHCAEVELLCVSGEEDKIHIGSMPLLRGLILCRSHGTLIQDLRKFTFGNLRVLVLYYTSVEDLDILRCSTQLEVLVVVECAALKRMPDLHGLTGLQRLILKKNKSLKVGCLSPALKEVVIMDCHDQTLDLEGLTGLERLILSGIMSLEEVRCFSPVLKEVLLDYLALKRLPDFQGLTGLERLKLCDMKSLEDVGCLSPALKEVQILWCCALKKLPDFRGLTSLERLTLCCVESLEEVGCLSPALKEIEIAGCPALKRLPDFQGLTGLERLTLRDMESLEEVGCLSPALKEVVVEWCLALQRLPDFQGLTSLESLTLKGNESLEEVGCLSPALKEVKVSQCRALKRLPDFQGLTGLERLRLSDNASLEEVGWRVSSALKEVKVSQCRALKRLPDFQVLTGLERLQLDGEGWGMKTLSVYGLSKLKQLGVGNWEDLEEIKGLENLKFLKALVLYNCGRLTDRLGHVNGLCQSPNCRTWIYGCPGLNIGTVK